MQFVNKRDLYCDESKAFILCEYKRELKLIKKLINISEEAIEKQDTHNTWSYEGICHSFVKTLPQARSNIELVVYTINE